MMLFYLMLGLAPHGVGFLGLGLLGLWAWASSFAKTNKNNFKCFGPCPFLLLIASFGFSSERVGTKGYIELYTTFSEEKNCKTIKILYLVIDANTSYDILLGRLCINRLMAIVSTPHL